MAGLSCADAGPKQSVPHDGCTPWGSCGQPQGAQPQWQHTEACLQVLAEGKLLRQQQQQPSAAPMLPSSSPPHAVDVLLGVVWRVVLDDPVHSRDVETPSCHIGAQQGARGGRAELCESASPPCLQAKTLLSELLRRLSMHSCMSSSSSKTPSGMVHHCRLLCLSCLLPLLTMWLCSLTGTNGSREQPCLLLLAVYVLHGHVDVVQQLRMVLDGRAGAEEHHHLRKSRSDLRPAGLIQAFWRRQTSQQLQHLASIRDSSCCVPRAAASSCRA